MFCVQNVLWDTLALTVNTSVSVTTVACVTDKMAGAPVQRAGWVHAVRWVKKNIKVLQ